MEEQDKVNPMLCTFYMYLYQNKWLFGWTFNWNSNVPTGKCSPDEEMPSEIQWNFNITWAKGLTKYVRYGDVLLHQGLFHIIFYYYWGEEYYFVIP